MSKLIAMKAVYCYFLPEVRPLLKMVESRLPDSMWLVTTPVQEVKQSLKYLFNPPLEIPATLDGYVNLDEIHVPIIDRIQAAYSGVVPGLDDFRYRYPTSGSSEGLFHILSKYRSRGLESINLLSGEYEGYSAYASHMGIRTNWIDPEQTNLQKMKPGVWFISNPSARDGNIIPERFIKELCDADHKVVLDLAYVGATKPHTFDTGHPNIDGVVISFSKPYGVFRFRIGGFAFTRDETPSLYGNKWFKDTVRLLQALQLAEAIGPCAIYPKYQPIQHEIINQLNKEFGIRLRSSDSFLLGHIPCKSAQKLSPEKLEMIAEFKRGNTYRLCLTPYFEMKERMPSNQEPSPFSWFLDGGF